MQARAQRQQRLLPMVREADETSGERQVGRSALSGAAKEGRTETVGLLLDRKAEIDAADQVRVPHPHADMPRRCCAGQLKSRLNTHLAFCSLKRQLGRSRRFVLSQPPSR